MLHIFPHDSVGQSRVAGTGNKTYIVVCQLQNGLFSFDKAYLVMEARMVVYRSGSTL